MVLAAYRNRKKTEMSKLTDIRNLIGKGEKSIKCPFCGLISEVISRDALNEYVGIRCNNCATYYIDISIFDNFDDAEYSYLISGYTRHFYPENGYGCFSTERLNQIIEKEKRFDCDSRKIAELIHYYDQKIAVLGQFAPIETYPAIAYCNGADDYDYIVRLAKLKKYIEFDEASYSLALTEEGARFSREELKRINLEKIMLHNSNSSKDVESRKKPVKIFISHSSKDEAAAKGAGKVRVYYYDEYDYEKKVINLINLFKRDYVEEKMYERKIEFVPAQ